MFLTIVQSYHGSQFTYSLCFLDFSHQYFTQHRGPTFLETRVFQILFERPCWNWLLFHIDCKPVGERRMTLVTLTFVKRHVKGGKSSWGLNNPSPSWPIAELQNRWLDSLRTINWCLTPFSTILKVSQLNKSCVSYLSHTSIPYTTDLPSNVDTTI